MTCTGAANVFSIALDGSFDDAQAALKEILADQEFRTATGSRPSTPSTSRASSRSAFIIFMLGCACRRRIATISSSSCPRETSAMCLPAGCSRKWACPSAASRWRPTRTTFSTACSRPAIIALGEVHPSLAPLDGHPGGVEFRAVPFTTARRPRPGPRARSHADVQERPAAMPFRELQPRHALPPRAAPTRRFRASSSRVHPRYGYIGGPAYRLRLQGSSAPTAPASCWRLPARRSFPTRLAPRSASRRRIRASKGLKSKPIVKYPHARRSAAPSGPSSSSMRSEALYFSEVERLVPRRSKR